MRFVGANVADGSTVVSVGWSGYARLKDVKHDPRVVGDASRITRELGWVPTIPLEQTLDDLLAYWRAAP